MADSDGVIQVLSCKKEERIPAFKTLPTGEAVTSLVTGQAAEQQDKLFAATGHSIKGINKKGKVVTDG